MTLSNKALLVLIALFQLFVSAGFGLAHDEAYYWLFSRELDWGYFDHPPFVAAIIWFFSFLPKAEWSVRIGFILLQFATIGILFRMLPQKIHRNVILLFFSFPLASFSGLLALPDMPLLFMTAVYCLSLQRYLEKRDRISIIALCLAIPLLLYAKYHGILLVFFTILSLPELLRRKEFYLIAFVSLLLFMPHIWWQWSHDFPTLRYHFLERPTSSFSMRRTLEFVLTQVGLAGLLVGPLVWLICGKNKTTDSFSRAMKAMAFGIVIFFFVSSFSKKTEANWTISVAVPLIYLVAASPVWERRWARVLLITSFSVVMLTRILFLLPPERVGIKRLKEFSGWQEWSQSIEKRCGDRPIAANTYQYAAKLSFYLDRFVPSLNYQSRANQFDLWSYPFKDRGQPLCYLSNNPQFEGQEVLTPEGKKLKLITTLSPEEVLSLKNEAD